MIKYNVLRTMYNCVVVFKSFYRSFNDLVAFPSTPPSFPHLRSSCVFRVRRRPVATTFPHFVGLCSCIRTDRANNILFFHYYHHYRFVSLFIIPPSPLGIFLSNDQSRVYIFIFIILYSFSAADRDDELP